MLLFVSVSSGRTGLCVRESIRLYTSTVEKKRTFVQNKTIILYFYKTIISDHKVNELELL